MTSKGNSSLNSYGPPEKTLLDNSTVTGKSKRLLLEACEKEGYTITDVTDKRISLTSEDGIPVEFDNAFLDDTTYYTDNPNYADHEMHTIEELLKYVNDAPEFMKKNVDKIIFDKDPDDFMWGYGEVPYGTRDVHIGYNTMDEMGYNSPQHTLYHEMAHCMEHFHKTGDIPEMTWFKNITQTEKSSGYANAHFNPHSDLRTENKYSENWAEAMKIVALHRVNPSQAFVSDPNGDQHSPRVYYDDWKKQNPRLNEVANKMLDCKNEEDVFNTVKELYMKYERN